jgi:predicted transcriptional regulator
MGYSELIEIAIKTEESIMGEAAEGLASDIKGLVVEDGEVIKIDGDGKEVLDELVGKYKAATGKVAPRMIADEIAEQTDGEEELPSSLRDL